MLLGPSLMLRDSFTRRLPVDLAPPQIPPWHSLASML
jgi:hypothetical protein